MECARLGAAVVAVEKTPDGVARIRANADAHGVDVDVVHGSAPQALAALPDDPDAVFVGGGGRELPAIVTAVRGGPGGRSSSPWPRWTGCRRRARR